MPPTEPGTQQGGLPPAPARLPGETEERYRALVAAIAEIVGVTTPEGRVDDIPAWRTLTGQSVEQIRGHGWLDALHPDDRARTAAAWAAATEAGSTYRTEYRVRRHDGVYRWMGVRGAPVFDRGGTLREWVGLCTDIDDGRRVELERQRLALVVERSSDFIALAGLGGEVGFVNQAGRAMAGLGPQAEAGALADCFAGEEQPRLRDEILPAVMRDGRWRGESAIRRPGSDEPTPVLCDAFRIDDPATGVATGAAVVARDITGLRESEAALRRMTETLEERVRTRTRDLVSARDQLRRLNATLEARVATRTSDLLEANEEIQRFAYIVSHDLRAPLVNILGFTNEIATIHAEIAKRVAAHGAGESLLPQAMQEDFDEAIGFVKDSAAKMDRLIGAILRISREGGRVFAPVPLDMVALLHSVAASLRHQCDARGATVSVAPDLPALAADRLAAEQVFTNLLENAVKYLAPVLAGRI